VPLVAACDPRLSAGGIDYLIRKDVNILPPELVLRELPKLDATDPDALVRFMKKYGPLTSPDQNGLRLLPASERKRFAGIGITPDGSGPIPIAVVSHHVRALQAMVGHWSAHQAEDDSALVDAWPNAGLPHPGDPLTAWTWWNDHMNAALASIPVRVEVWYGSDRRVGGDLPSRTTSYSAMVVQIFNDVATGTAWRRCANETCGGLFARQQGRAEAGQHRTTGVRYCTSSCAKAQVERERRRRIAKDRKKGNDSNG
jgi:hypothetical protein